MVTATDRLDRTFAARPTHAAGDPGPAGEGRGLRQRPGAAVHNDAAGRLEAPCCAAKTEPRAAVAACTARGEALKEVAVWTAGYRRFWEESYDKLDEYPMSPGTRKGRRDGRKR
jgi:hypothetical protein